MRRPSLLGTIVSAVVLLGVGLFALRPVGPLPALGPLLDPANGIWSAVTTAELPANATDALDGLGADTRVVYDDRAVPHIFARNVRDAYRALGYVVARDRLFQMELVARAGGGTLTEMVGARALEADRDTRSSGMPSSAEDRLQHMDTTTATFALTSAYVAGANAFIRGLSPRDYPLEYKLLGRAPTERSVLDVLHVLNRMGATLASSSDELTHLQAAARVGSVAADALFPMHSPIVEPIQPNGARAPRYQPTKLPPPGAPDANAQALLNTSPSNLFASLTAFAPSHSDDAIGSNNWAVASTRTAAGHAILAGDPHLELTLPSIWYEAHLVVPDTLDVYGVTIPGAPGIIIGFTQAVSWTFTNTGADVMDYYVEDVANADAPTKYAMDGSEHDLRLRPETYRDQLGRVIHVDTLRFNHRGPLRKVGTRWISTRWTVLESMRVLEGFDAASRAKTSAQFLDGMAALYDAPAQNMLTADTTGAIGIRSTGRYPLRPDNGRGDVLRDGSKSSNDWVGNWPVADYPQSLKPRQGFLVSANQEPFDPLVQPRYFGASWERPWRAININRLLRNDSTVTPDAMRRFQTDPASARAEEFMPYLLAAGARGDSLAVRTAQLLGEWDMRYTRDNRRAVLFEEVMRRMTVQLWDEFRADSGRVSIPNDMMTAVLLTDSLSKWWDDQRTPSVEHRDDILRSAMSAALDSIVRARGEPTDDRWRWDHVRFANIDHVLRLAPFSRRQIPVQGGSATIWPSTGDGKHGPSWRMVVEMSTPRRAWATYPGGQSGNPLSVRYDDRLASWREGKLDTLRLPTSESQLSSITTRAQLTLTPKRGGH